MTNSPPPWDANSSPHLSAEINVLIVSDDVTFLDSLSQTLHIRLPTLGITSYISSGAAIGQISATEYDAIVVEFRLLTTDGEQLLATLRATQPPIPLVVVCKIEEYRRAIAVLGQEAYDIIPKPISWEYFAKSLRSALYSRQINRFKAKTYNEEQSWLTNQQMLQGLKVLLVDDDADSRYTEEIMLLSFGAEVLALCSVQAALVQLEQFQPDILVSDIRMPLQDGYSLIRQLRRRSALSGGEIPALALTAYADEEERTTALQAGFDLQLAKPIELLVLGLAVALLAGRIGEF
ncbi:MAG: Regulator of RpoS [Chroococcidiopsis cubana SAG 39.79]|uniref:Response regulatory domain-containing protein n=1 Tax=Chroococcidiopsis cubana SAG 39.79 TaxID=388085 RepID=A0AB37U8J5_9CYAN|nr:response regulator [Chroococcidiopsis cubana]MDZ4879017.1 Regulator of RpoS [Chroococcidiopsis cubana SAG 39.79]PSB57763.1 hypothetical protein C7B79_30595 [Chroococcidiopsis cubana CCALA 043]RUS95312.1 hypothetical protein DSM107010_71300 [Chroococcidiopsis cubana SAG 39.79]